MYNWFTWTTGNYATSSFNGHLDTICYGWLKRIPWEIDKNDVKCRKSCLKKKWERNSQICPFRQILVHRFYSGPRPDLHWSFCEDRADKPTNQSINRQIDPLVCLLAPTVAQEVKRVVQLCAGHLMDSPAPLGAHRSILKQDTEPKVARCAGRHLPTVTSAISVWMCVRMDEQVW